MQKGKLDIKEMASVLEETGLLHALPESHQIRASTCDLPSAHTTGEKQFILSDGHC
jgi:hypothetical protein